MALSLDEAREKRSTLQTELRGLESRIQTNAATDGQLERAENLSIAIERLSREVEDGEQRLEAIRAKIDDPRYTESGANFTAPGPKRARDEAPGHEARSEALRAVERGIAEGDLPAEAEAHVGAVISADRMGVEARYISAVADPNYASAFRKRLFGGNGAQATLNAAEAEALAKVGQVMSERAMLVGEESAGGFALPVQVDPTFQLVSDGALSPLRELATVTATTSPEFRGGTTEGIAAAFAKEGEEVGDGTPEFEPIKARPQRAHAFTPYSVEMGQDLGGLSAELTRLFADAKDVLEANKFLYGTGEDEPTGLLYKVAESSLVETKVKEKLEAGDVYTLIEKLAPRWQSRANWLSSLTVANQIHRFSGPGGEEAPLFDESRTKLLGKPWHEVSGMSVKSTTAKEQVLLYGDLGQFRIIDRLGMSVETIPHLFGEEGRPLGVRGLYCIWRTTSVLQTPNAIRVLAVKS